MDISTRAGDEQIRFIVRDARPKGFFWMDNEIIDVFAPTIGIVGCALYAYLCRHTWNETQRCEKKQADIATALACSPDTVQRHLGKLVESGLVAIEKGNRGGEVHTYFILQVPKTVRTANCGTVKKPRKAANCGTTRRKKRPARPQKAAHNKEAKLSQDSLQDLNPLSHEATTDPRRKDFIEDLKKYREHLSGPGSFQPTGADFKNLDTWLSEHPKTDQETFRRCLSYRAQSAKAKEVNAAEEIYRWIGKILEFSEGPLDRYGKPLGVGTNGKREQKTETINTEISRALAERRRAGRVAGSEAGNASEFVT